MVVKKRTPRKRTPINGKVDDNVQYPMDITELCKYNLDPVWQRNDGIWSNSKISSYRSCILNKRPIAPILLVGNDVLDGKQRISTLLKFLDDPSLSKDHKKKFLNYTFPVVVYSMKYFRSNEDIVLFFKEVNSAGTSLNAQELRRAVNYDYPFIQYAISQVHSRGFERFIEKFCYGSEVSEVLASLHKRYTDEDVLLKIIATFFRNNLAIEWKMANEVNCLRDREEGELIQTMERCYKAFGIVYHDEKSCEPLKKVPLISASKWKIPAIVGFLGKLHLKKLRKHKQQVALFLKDIWLLPNKEFAAKNNLIVSNGSGSYQKAVIDLMNQKFTALDLTK